MLFYVQNITSVENNRIIIGLHPVIDGFDNDSKGPYFLMHIDGYGGVKKVICFELLGFEVYWYFSKK